MKYTVGTVLIALTLAIGAAVACLAAWLWNAVVGPMFGLPAVQWWQVWAILALLGIVRGALFGSGKA